jgi:hypothetical protein
MITLTLIALLIFVPSARGILGGFVSGIFSLLGLVFFISRDPGGRRQDL